MQADEHNYQPDEQFTDHGWSEMLKTLDQEMPVQKKKRRGFFWLFPLLLIGGIASVWAIYLLSTPSGSGSEFLSNEQLTNYSTPEISNEGEIKVINELGDISSSNKVEKIDISTQSKVVEVNDKYPLITQFSNTSTDKSIELEALENDSTEKTVKLNSDNSFFYHRFDTELIAIDPSIITLKLHDMGKKNLVFPEFYFENEEELVECQEKSFKEKMEFGVFAGGVSDFSQIKKLGVSGGLTVDFPLFKKFGIRTGLGYTQLRKEQPYVFIGNQEANLSSDFFDVATAAPPFETVAVQSRAYFVLENLHQLDLPVLFTYVPGKKIQFQLGGNLSYLLKAQTRLTTSNLFINNTVNDDYAVFGVELSDLDNNTITQNQYLEEEYWNQLNISAVAGVEWRPFKKWAFGLQYHHGFLPILKSQNNNDNSPELVQSIGSRSFEVYDNSGGFNADLNTPIGNSFLEKSFPRDRFIRHNHSLRLSVGYKF